MSKRGSWTILRAANGILAGGGIFGLLSLFYVVRRYGWMPTARLDGDVAFLGYYLVPGVAAVLLFSSLLLRPSIRTGVALVLCSTAVSLYFVEITLQLVEHLGSREQQTLWTPWDERDLDELVRLAERHGVTYDTRSKFEVVTELRSADPEVSPVIVPKALLTPQRDGTLKSIISIDGREVVALGGISNRTTVFCNESGVWISYLSDEHGFHNPAGIWNRSAIDIAVLGDSYAQGVCVPSHKNAVALIRSRYPATLNLGMLGSGPLEELALLKEYAAEFRPRIVLWFFYEENDFADLTGTRKSPLLLKYLDGGYRQGLSALQPAIDEALEDYVADEMQQIGMGGNGLSIDRAGAGKIGSVTRSVVFLRSLRGRLGMTLGSRSAEDHRVVSDETMDLLRKIFAETKAAAATWGGELYLVYLPERQRYSHRRTAALSEANRKRMLRLAEDLGVSVIDIHSAIQSHDDPLSLYPFRRRGHFNEDGYRLVAESVLRSIAIPGEGHAQNHR